MLPNTINARKPVLTPKRATISDPKASPTKISSPGKTVPPNNGSPRKETMS